MTDLQVQYNARQKHIKASLALLKKKLADHAKDQAKDSRNWGHVGDLARTDRLLNELLECV